jgi:RHS repeat-associated protein
VNFQPALSPIPEGFVADKGKMLTERRNGLVYGWSAAQDGQVERRVFPVPQFDTHIRMQPEGQSAPGQWSFALPNGTYAVVVVMGDPASRNQTNDIAINSVAKLDSTPATTETEYRQGNFDGYIENITVTDGLLHIEGLVTALDPKLCFIEIGTEGVLATQAERDRLAAVIETVNNFTANNHSVAEQIEAYVYGSYIDEVLAYVQTSGGTTSRYYPHSNHLYSVAAITDVSGAVVERYSYDAYGTRTVTTPGGTVLPKSTIGFQRGFTGYQLDEETGLYYARARMYSPKLGIFLGRNAFASSIGWSYRSESGNLYEVALRSTMTNDIYELNYMIDGPNLYAAGFAQFQGLDPTGEPWVYINGQLVMVHGNSGSSVSPHHIYEIYDSKTNMTYKYGISGAPLNGSVSGRASRQVAALNARGNNLKYRLIAQDLPGRQLAFAVEESLVSRHIHIFGRRPLGNIRPLGKMCPNSSSTVLRSMRSGGFLTGASRASILASRGALGLAGILAGASDMGAAESTVPAISNEEYAILQMEYENEYLDSLLEPDQ